MAATTALERSLGALANARKRLTDHYAACTAGCTATDIRCSYGWEYVGREEEAWWAAKGEHLAARPATAPGGVAHAGAHPGPAARAAEGGGAS